MTQKEFKRLRLFIKQHKDSIRNFNLFFITYEGDFYSGFNVIPSIDEVSFNNIDFKHIKNISFWISTNKEVFYF